MFRVVIVLACAFVAAQSVWCEALAAKRFALLIGNKGYDEAVGALENPHNDVGLLGVALTRLGFEVTAIKDASYRQMDIAIKRHVERVRTAGDGSISFFYYSGHGIANPDTNMNYLVPIDVRKADDANIWFESFQQNEIINRLSEIATSAIHYVVFDACRDELKLTGPQAKSLGRKKGFVPVPQTAGILIAYSTAPGETASDAGAGGGPYARVLAEEITRPGVDAVAMFRNVHRRVKRSIGQDPWMSLPTLPDVYLAGSADEKSPEAVQSGTRSNFDQQAELAYWKAVQDSKDPTAINSYIQQFPNGVFVPLARILVGKLEAAERAEAEAETKREKLKTAEQESQAAEAKRDQAEQQPNVAADTGELERAREDARKAREALAKANEERSQAIANAEQATEEAEQLKRELNEAANRRSQELANADTRQLEANAEDKNRQADFVKEVQVELKRLRCLADVADGLWGAKSRRALSDFNKLAGRRGDVSYPTADDLSRLQGWRRSDCASLEEQPESAGLKLPRGTYTLTDGRKVHLSCKLSGSCFATVSAGGLIGPSKVHGKIDKSGHWTGTWVIGLSLRRCRTKKFGSYYWGRITAKFNASRTAWRGRTSHCDGPWDSDSIASR